MTETALIEKIKAQVKLWRAAGVPVKCLKLHGSRFQEAGTPDLHFTLNGKSYWLEAKIGREEPTKLQERRLQEWSAAGAVVGVVWSVADVAEILDLPLTA